MKWLHHNEAAVCRWKSHWRPAFAWLPVIAVGHGRRTRLYTVWLEWVERREVPRVYKRPIHGMRTEYRLPNTTEKEEAK